MALIHEERTTDYVAIERVLIDAFARAEHASGREHLIVDSLRRDDALTLALVAEQDHTILGHVAFSPVRIDGRSCGWHGLGPVAVRPSHQARGIGTALIREGLARLRQSGLRRPGYAGVLQPIRLCRHADPSLRRRTAGVFHGVEPVRIQAGRLRDVSRGVRGLRLTAKHMRRMRHNASQNRLDSWVKHLERRGFSQL